MESLNISGATLQRFPEIGHRPYESIDASWNSIRVLWEDDIPATTQTLNLEGNHIGSDGLPENWPDAIHTLNLSQNCIVSLSEVIHWPASLRVLNLASNNLDGVLNCRNLPPTLEELDISFTNIISIVAFPPNLKMFTAISTCLQMLPERCPDSLKKCTVANSRNFRRTGLPSFWGTSLEYLELHGLRLREFPRNLPATIRTLNLSKNLLQTFCVEEKFPPSLRTLHLGDNRIFEIPGWLSKFRDLLYTIPNNLLTVVPTSSNCLAANSQLIGSRYGNAALMIQKNWRVYKMGPPIRSWYRVSILKEELLAVAMCPERAGKFEDVSPEWGLPYHLFVQPQPPPTKSYVPASDAAQ